MSDRDLRSAERAALTGDPDSQARLDAERQRRGLWVVYTILDMVQGKSRSGRRHDLARIGLRSAAGDFVAVIPWDEYNPGIQMHSFCRAIGLGDDRSMQREVNVKGLRVAARQTQQGRFLVWMFAPVDEVDCE